MKQDTLASIAEALARAGRPPASGAELGPRVATLERELALPGDAWSRWLLLALHRHEARQAWAGELVRTRLRGDLRAIGRAGAFGHPDGEQGGDVPGLPGWTYFFHGSGCCLSRLGGEVIDVDFDDGGTESIDPYFYGSYLQSVAGGPRAEPGLPCTEPFREAWMTDLVALRELGWIEGDHAFRLTPLGRGLAALLQPGDDDSWLAAAWHACVVGRLDVAAARFDGAPVPPELVRASAALVECRAAALEARIDGRGGRFALEALAALGRAHAEPTVARQLRRDPLDGMVSAALDLLAGWGIAEHREVIAATMTRARGDEVPAPHIRARCAELLLAASAPGSLTGPERERLLAALQQPGSASGGEQGLLLYLLDERLGLAQLRAALASEVPIARHEAAGALGIIGTAEALAILRGVEGAEAATILAVLRGHAPVNGPEPVGEAIEWEGRTRQVYRMEEVLAAQVGDFTVEVFDRMQERYGPLVRRWLAS